jgi:hypothetical protein
LTALLGTNKKNILALISILFLEMFAASPKKRLRGVSVSAHRTVGEWGSTHCDPATTGFSFWITARAEG